MRARHLAGALLAALVLLPVMARAECAPIQVVLMGTVIKEAEERPVSNYPITIRMETSEGGLGSLSWEATVTDADGRFRWTRDFPADPCREGFFLKRYVLGAWGWLTHPLSKTYRRRARALPRLIVLNLGQRILRIERDEILENLDGNGRLAEVEIPVEL